VALLLRLLLVGPADLYARLAGSLRIPTPGTVDYWLREPAIDGDFLRLFVLSTWWVGAVVGVILVWRRGGSWADRFCGAGAFAGLGGAATLGCVLVAVDAVPRGLLALITGVRGSSSAVLGTLLWLVLAVFCWAVLGAGLGAVLGVVGQRGARLLVGAAAPLAWLFRLFRLERAASFFALQG
jgi:hypothetical protein